MTKDQILAMEPGPELNKLIGTKVMGWELDSTNNVYRDGTWRRSVLNYAFSLDLVDAWGALNTLLTSKIITDINITIGRDHKATVYLYDEGIVIATATCRAISEAICKVALLAVMKCG